MRGANVRSILQTNTINLAGGGASEIERMKQTAHKLPAHRNGDELSRRSFLASAGVTAGGAVLETSLSMSRALADEKPNQAIIGPDSVPLTLRINGAARTIN